MVVCSTDVCRFKTNEEKLKIKQIWKQNLKQIRISYGLKDFFVILSIIQVVINLFIFMSFEQLHWT